MVHEDEVLYDASMIQDNTMNMTSMVNSMMALVGPQQPVWFGNIMPSSWQRELSKEKLEKELHDYYSTSKILETVNSFSESYYGVENKWVRHGLINCTHSEFKKKA